MTSSYVGIPLLGLAGVSPTHGSDLRLCRAAGIGLALASSECGSPAGLVFRAAAGRGVSYKAIGSCHVGVPEANGSTWLAKGSLG